MDSIRSSTESSPSSTMPRRTRPVRNSPGSRTPLMPRFSAAKSFRKFPWFARSAASTPNRIRDAKRFPRGQSSATSSERKSVRTAMSVDGESGPMARSWEGSRQRPPKTPVSKRRRSRCSSSFLLSTDRKAKAARRSCAEVLRTESETVAPAERHREWRGSLPSTVAGRISPASFGQRCGVPFGASQVFGSMCIGSCMLKP
mmetsp:Transcript_94292/g.271709  ORF Transcript_94292/g.271709 Transcript_94292/m.271709 type:complete len:201 (+) Transcript_94292:347-949(+)